MSKSLKFSLLVIVIIIVPILVFAMVVSAEEGETTCTSCQQSQVRVEAQANNPETSEANQTQTRAQEEEQIQLKIQERVETCEMNYEPKAEQIKSRQGEVNGAITELSEMSASFKDISAGEKIYYIARRQAESEDKINEAMDKVEDRGAIVEFFFGADYKNLKLAKQEMEQNRLRIEELNRIMAQIENEGDLSNLQEQITILENQNVNLENQLNDNSKGFSLLGWFFRMLYGY